MNARYTFFITPAGQRSYKKLPTPVIRFVENDLITLLEKNPQIGKPLTPPLQPLRSFHFSQQGQPYRAVYTVQEARARVIIHFVGHCRDFYDRLRRLLGM